MPPDMKVVPQDCQSTDMYPQGKWNTSAPIISSMDRGTHFNTSVLSYVFLSNLSKTRPSNGCCGAWNGYILTCRSCPNLANPLIFICKANGTQHQQSAAPLTKLNTATYQFCPVHFCQIYLKPTLLIGVVGPEWDASWHEGHGESLSIHYHPPSRKIDHDKTNHKLHGQRYTPQQITSILCFSAKSAQNQLIRKVLWGMRGMHSEMQVMSQACQSTVIHPKGKWNMPAAIISFINRGAHHNVSFLSCVLLLNVPKTSPSAGCCVAWKGCILQCRSYPRLVIPLSCIHKANVTGQY